MSEKLKFWATFALALIGALAWMPSIVTWLKPNKIVGKMISRYNNLNADRTQTLFLYKLSILSKNKSFNLNQIKCEIEDHDGNKFLASAENNRLVVFTYENPKKLLVSGEDFLNNSSFLSSNKNITGYLFFKFNGDLDFKPLSTTFIFESFENKIRRLKIKESDTLGKELFFDDTIWQTIDENYIQDHPAIKASTKK